MTRHKRCRGLRLQGRVNNMSLERWAWWKRLGEKKEGKVVFCECRRAGIKYESGGDGKTG